MIALQSTSFYGQGDLTVDLTTTAATARAHYFPGYFKIGFIDSVLVNLSIAIKNIFLCASKDTGSPLVGRALA